MFPSSRVIAASLVNRETLNAGIAVLYDQLDLHLAVARDYHSLETTCQDQKSQIDRLQVELRSYVDILPRLAAHVQDVISASGPITRT